MEQIQLDHGVSCQGLMIETLEMRRPKVSDMLFSETLKGSDAQKEIRLFANLCDVAPEVIESLDMKDYITLQKHYRNFLS